MVKKYMSCVILFFLACLTLLTGAGFADGYVVDEAGLFEDIGAIEAKLAELEAMLGYPAYIVTTDIEYGQNPFDAANLLLMDRVGKNQNGVMLAINMASRDITFTTSGPKLQADAMSDDEIHALREDVGAKFTAGEYDAAAMLYCDRVRRALGGNYLSGMDMLIAGISSLLGAGGYGAAQYARYHPRNRKKPFPMSSNVAVALSESTDTLIDTREIVTVIPKNKSGGSGGGGSTSRNTGGGSFRGSSGKF